MTDPFALLGLDPGATAADVRAARRQLAKHRHPDAGGDAGDMRELNEAAAAALRLIDKSLATSEPDDADAADSPSHDAAPQPRWHGSASDMPSFTVEALPVEAFEALLIATSVIGEVIDDDPPYRLEVLLADPVSCWCRLELVPDAGASTVSVTIAAIDDRPRPSVELVRDIWIEQLNRLDW